jgi:hypothetical protein
MRRNLMLLRPRVARPRRLLTRADDMERALGSDVLGAATP